MNTYIEFRSTYTDDSKFDSDGNCVEPNGRNIMEAFAAWVRDKCEKTDRVDLHSFYGWSIQLRISRGWVWQMIQNPDPWLLIAEAGAFRIPYVNAKSIDGRLRESLNLFKDFLDQDENLDFVAEYTRDEYQASSSGLPGSQ